MFERYVDNRHKKRRRWIGLAVSASAVAHFTVITFFIVTAMWQIDKLTVAKTPTVWVAKSGPPPGMGAPPPLQKKKAVTKKKKKTVKKRSRELLQPNPDGVALDEADTDYGDGTSAIGVPGGTGTDPYGVGTGVGGPDIGIGDDLGGEDLCSRCPDCCAPDEPPVIIPANLIEGKLVAGNKQITPPDTVKLEMANQDQKQLITSVRMCLDKRGSVTSIERIKSSGYLAYDSKIEREMNGWRYEPYKVNGKAIPVCTAITFIYRMH